MAYIKKEDAINEVLTLRDYSVNNEEKVAFSLVYRKLRELPTAEVAEVKHGEWSHLGGDEWCCTNCGKVISTEGSWEKPTQKYCNECGAVMDGQ